MVWLLKDQNEQYDWTAAPLPFQFSVVIVSLDNVGKLWHKIIFEHLV